MRISASSKSDLGQIREGNEDFVLLDEKLGLYVVCDGMGGHAAGEVASRAAAEALAERVRQRLPAVRALAPERRPAALAEMMRDAVERANARVYELGESDLEKRGAGTTCTALVIHGGTAALAHVGDSRLYLVRAGEIYQISNDHTFVAEAVRRGMTRDEALAQFGMNMLARAVGPLERIDIDTLAFDLLPGDRLLLCSDGLYNYFPDPRELVPLLERVSEAPERLVRIANERGGEDNISALALEVAEDVPATMQDTLRHARITQNLRALGGIELFRELTFSEVLEVAGSLRTAEFETGAEILGEGDTSHSLYIIADGAVEVQRAGKRLALLGSGSHFGEMALLTNRPRSATVRATGDCRVLILARDQLYPLFQNNPVIAVKFLWNLSVRQCLRLDEASEWLSTGSERAPDTVIDRIAASPFSLRHD